MRPHLLVDQYIDLFVSGMNTIQNNTKRGQYIGLNFCDFCSSFFHYFAGIFYKYLLVYSNKKCHMDLQITWIIRQQSVFQGAFSEITGPVIPELIAQTQSSYETIAQSVSMRGAGHALGGIIGQLGQQHYCDNYLNLPSWQITILTYM